MSKDAGGYTLIPVRKPPPKKKPAPKKTTPPPVPQIASGLLDRENVLARRDSQKDEVCSALSKVGERKEQENRKLQQKVEKKREKMMQEIKPIYEKFKKEIEGKGPLTGLSIFRDAQKRLSSASVSGSGDSEGKDLLSPLQEITIQNIMNFLGLFEDMILGATCKRFRDLYVKQRKSENCVRAGYFYSVWHANNASWNERSEAEKKLYDSGQYEIVRTVAEQCWLGTDLFLESPPPHTELKNAFLALAIIPKKGYLSSLARLWPYAYSNYSGDDINLSKNYANSIIATQPKFAIDQFIGENLENPDLQELLACIVGELIVTNSFPPSGTINNVTKFYEKMISAKHPLTSLPCRLRGIEHGATPGDIRIGCRGSYGFCPPSVVARGRVSTPHFLSAGSKKKAFDPKRKKFSVKDITSLENEIEMHTAISYFYGYICLILEVQDLDRQLTASDILSVVVDGEVKCLKGLKAEDISDGYGYTLSSAESAFGTLFSLSANGGCYSECWAGSYARMDAWRSLAAIVGVPFSEGLAAIEQKAKQCIYLNFDAEKGEFFQYCGQNVGLAVLRPDRKTVAVLCITDSD